MSQIIIRFFVGGVVVSAFALIADLLKPKSFAGLFGAAPSVALATLALTVATEGTPYAAKEARSMMAGSIAFFVYASFVSWILMWNRHAYQSRSFCSQANKVARICHSICYWWDDYGGRRSPREGIRSRRGRFVLGISGYLSSKRDFDRETRNREEARARTGRDRTRQRSSQCGCGRFRDGKRRASCFCMVGLAVDANP